MKNMTSGPISRQLVSYSVPLILGNFFQLTYNAVDSIILGRFAGKESLAAVGVANPLMNILIFFIVGICIGAGILISEFYGAGDMGKLKREISTTIALGFFFTIIVSLICYFALKPLLFLMRTPKELIAPTARYLRIVIAGLIFTFFYNVFASTLRSVGDSKTPIICVSISAVLNGILDVILVAGFKLEMAGAAIATVFSQFFSCVLIIAYVYLKAPELAVRPREFKVDKNLLKQTVNYSWISALQQTVLYVGKLLIQSAVNPLGIDAIATFNAGTKIDDFAYAPTQSISSAITTFMAQNRGAKNPLREHDGFWKGLRLEVTYALSIAAVVILLGRQLMWLFAGSDEPAVIEMGQKYLLLMGCFYIFPGVANGIQGFFRGLGDMKVTLASTTIQIIFRVGFSYLLAPKLGVCGVAYACLAGWIGMLTFEGPLLFHANKKLKNAYEK